MLLKSLVVIIVFLSLIMINIFDDNKQNSHNTYIENQFIYTGLDRIVDTKMEYNSNTKFIYLSFDDGPLNGSQNINKIINIEKIPINVMVVGAHVEGGKKNRKYFDDYINNIYIEVNNHSYSHANHRYKNYYLNPIGVLYDFNKSMNYLELDNKIARLPGRNVWRVNGEKKGGDINTKESANLLSSNGFKIIGWDVEWRYNPITKKPLDTYKEMFSKIKHQLDNNSTFINSNIVILAHDSMFRSKKEAQKLQDLIRLIKTTEDYAIVPLSKYPIIL